MPSRAGLMVLAFALAGAAMGGFEAALHPSQMPRLQVAVFAAGLALLPAALLGLLAWGATRLYPRLPKSAAVAAWFERSVTPTAGGDRGPVVRFHAAVLAALVVFIVAAMVSTLVYSLLFGLQVRQVAMEVAALFAVVQMLGALLGFALLSRGLRRPLGWVDRRFGMPRPRALWVRWLLLVVLPLFIGLYPFLLRHGEMLSWLRDGLMLLLLTTLGIGFALLLGSRAARQRWRRAGALLLVVAGLGWVAVGVAAQRYPRTTGDAERSMLAAVGARLARTITDVDRDGASALFAGGDCAAFDGARAPGLADIPNNGIDEDCDGSDSEKGANVAQSLTRFSGMLRKKQVRKYNIVWVVMETVRADHVSAYGYPKPTMPYFEQLAAESLLFERAYAQASATLLSIPSMMTGVNPGAMTWTTHQLLPQAVPDELLLAERLKAHGYQTGAVFENYTKRNFPGMFQGIDKVQVGEPDKSGRYNRARRNPFANVKAADFFARVNHKKPFFWIQYYVDPHGPYTRHRDVDNSKFARDKPGNYDSELRWTDEALRAFIEMLRSRPVIWNNTVVIITADHGEEFYEHGTHSHATSCHEESVHVPLLVRVPGVKAQRVKQPVALVDVVPTVMELVGAEGDNERLSGQSLLLPALKPGAVKPKRPLFCSIASVTDKYGTFLRRSVRQGKYALIYEVTKNQLKLFDMEADPGEQNNLAERPDQRARLTSMKAILDASLIGNLREHTRMRTNQKR